MDKLINFFKDEEGAGMVEYALLVGLVGVFLIVVIVFMRDEIGRMFGIVGNELNELDP